MYEYFDDMYGGDFLQHHGVKGMHWGIRRYQNYDGTRIGAKRRVKKTAGNVAKNLKRVGNSAKTIAKKTARSVSKNVKRAAIKIKTEKKEYDAGRLDRAIARGDARTVQKYIPQMSDQKIKAVNERFKNINSVKVMAKAQKGSFTKTMDNVGNVLNSFTKFHENVNKFKKEFGIGQDKSSKQSSGVNVKAGNSEADRKRREKNRAERAAALNAIKKRLSEMKKKLDEWEPYDTDVEIPPPSDLKGRSVGRS